MRDIQEERQELVSEIILYKNKISNALQPDEPFTDIRGLELEEENSHLTAENLEVRLKLKQLSEKNHILQIRILELNSQKGGHQKKESEEHNNDEDDNSFLEGIQIAENIN